MWDVLEIGIGPPTGKGDSRMTVTGELLIKAQRLSADLEAFRADLEHSTCRPAVKSALSRDILESQERLDAVVRACTPEPQTMTLEVLA